MEPDLQKLFLGQTSENQPFFQEMIDLVTDDYIEGRRARRPSEPSASPEKPSQGCFLTATEEALTELAERLREGTPAYPNRLIPDTLMAATLGHLAALFHSPLKPALLDREVGEQFVRLIGHDPERSEAIFTPGGPAANKRFLWLARSLKSTATALVATRADLLAGCDDIGRANLPVERLLRILDTVEEEGRLSELRAGAHQTGGALGKLLVPAPQVKFWRGVAHQSGLAGDDVVPVPMGCDFRLDVSALRGLLLEMIAAAVPVLAVVAVVGTSDLGRVDPVDQILELRRELFDRFGAGFYLHIDATRGGYARSLFLNRTGAFTSNRGKEKPSHHAFRSLPEADSVAVSPDREGYLPHPVGSLLMKDRRALRSLPEEMELATDEVGPAIASLWVAHRVVPLAADGYGRLVAHGLEWAEGLFQTLRESPAMEVEGRRFRLEPLVEPELAVVAFLVREEGTRDPVAINRLNRFLQERFSCPPGPGELPLSGGALRYEQYRSAFEELSERLEIPVGEWPEVGELLFLWSCTASPYLPADKGIRDVHRRIVASLERHLRDWTTGRISRNGNILVTTRSNLHR